MTINDSQLIMSSLIQPTRTPSLQYKESDTPHHLVSSATIRTKTEESLDTGRGNAIPPRSPEKGQRVLADREVQQDLEPISTSLVHEAPISEEKGDLAIVP